MWCGSRARERKECFLPEHLGVSKLFYLLRPHYFYLAFATSGMVTAWNMQMKATEMSGLGNKRFAEAQLVGRSKRNLKCP